MKFAALFISEEKKLLMKYSSLLGLEKEEEERTHLSWVEEQKQRVGIARALANNPQVAFIVMKQRQLLNPENDRQI